LAQSGNLAFTGVAFGWPQTSSGPSGIRFFPSTFLQRRREPAVRKYPPPEGQRNGRGTGAGHGSGSSSSIGLAVCPDLPRRAPTGKFAPQGRGRTSRSAGRWDQFETIRRVNGFSRTLPVSAEFLPKTPGRTRPVPQTQPSSQGTAIDVNLGGIVEKRLATAPHSCLGRAPTIADVPPWWHILFHQQKSDNPAAQEFEFRYAAASVDRQGAPIAFKRLPGCKHPLRADCRLFPMT